MSALIMFFLSPKGRIGRLACALGCVFSAIIVPGLVTVAAKTGLTAHLPMFLVILIGFGLKIANYSLIVLGAKRTHDLGKSHLWFASWAVGGLATVLVLLAESQAYDRIGHLNAARVVGCVNLLFVAVWTWKFFIKLLFDKGDSGPNSFGPPGDALSQYFNYGNGAAAPIASQGDAASSLPIAAIRATRVMTPRGNAKPTSFNRRNS